MPNKLGQGPANPVYLVDSGSGTDATVQLAAGTTVQLADGTSIVVSGVTLPAAIRHGQTVVASAGTEVTLTTTQAIVTGVIVKALSTNTDLMYVGANPVTSSTGFELAAGEQVFIAVADLTTVWIDSAVNGEGVSWIAT